MIADPIAGYADDQDWLSEWLKLGTDKIKNFMISQLMLTIYLCV
jgi:hypothetical protein